MAGLLPRSATARLRQSARKFCLRRPPTAFNKERLAITCVDEIFSSGE